MVVHHVWQTCINRDLIPNLVSVKPHALLVARVSWQHSHIHEQASERRQASPLLGCSVYESHKWLFNIVVIRVVIWVELSLIVARHASPTPATHMHVDTHRRTHTLTLGQTGCSRSNSHHMPTNWAVMFFLCVWAFFVCVCACLCALRLWSS